MKGNLEHVVERATDVADKLLPVMAHHVPPVLLAAVRTKDVNIITKMSVTTILYQQMLRKVLGHL